MYLSIVWRDVPTLLFSARRGVERRSTELGWCRRRLKPLAERRSILTPIMVAAAGNRLAGVQQVTLVVMETTGRSGKVTAVRSGRPGGPDSRARIALKTRATSLVLPGDR